MLIVMETWSTDEHSKEEYDYAIFKMESNEAKLIAQKLNLYKVMRDSDSELRSMSFRAHGTDLEPEFYASSIWNGNMPDDIETALDKEGWASVERLDPDITPRAAHASNGIYLVIEDEGFYWRTYPPDSMIQIETQLLPREILSRVL